jgi:hypothetical protein
MAMLGLVTFGIDATLNLGGTVSQSLIKSQVNFFYEILL